MEKCSNCGKPAKIVRGDYHLKELPFAIWLVDIELIKCRSCGNVDPIIPNLDGLMQVLDTD